MSQYDRISVLQGIDISKTSESKECMLCHYWYFKDVSYEFQPYLCNAKGVDYRCILWGISREEAVNRLNKSALEDKSVL